MVKTTVTGKSQESKDKSWHSLKIIHQNPSQNNAGQLKSWEHPAFSGRGKCQAPHLVPKQQHNYKIREQYWAE